MTTVGNCSDRSSTCGLAPHKTSALASVGSVGLLQSISTPEFPSAKASHHNFTDDLTCGNISFGGWGLLNYVESMQACWAYLRSCFLYKKFRLGLSPPSQRPGGQAQHLAPHVQVQHQGLEYFTRDDVNNSEYTWSKSLLSSPDSPSLNWSWWCPVSGPACRPPCPASCPPRRWWVWWQCVTPSSTRQLSRPSCQRPHSRVLLNSVLQFKLHICIQVQSSQGPPSESLPRSFLW